MMDGLCAYCSACFDDKALWVGETYRPHHDIRAMADSAATGCHLCSLILSQISTADTACLQNDFENSHANPLGQIAISIRGGDTITLWVAASNSSVPRKGWDICKADWTALARLHVRLRKDDYTSEIRSLSEQNFSDSSVEQVFAWIEECQSEHAQCRKVQPVAATKKFLPTRLLDLTSALENSRIKLCSSQALSPNIKYVTLSHCWGGTCGMMLTKNEKPAFEQGISVDILPKSFRDAVRVTRRLGLYYLWIDALW
jgi:hypothetical protein